MLFEEPGASKKDAEAQPLEPSAFESESSAILEPEPLELEPLEPEPVGLESADETGRPMFAPLATGSESQALDTLESLDVEGVDAWGAKEDVTKRIPTPLITDAGSGRQAVEKWIAPEPPAKPEMLSDDLSLLEAVESEETRPGVIKPESDDRGMEREPALDKRPFEARPFGIESPPEILPAESIELPSVDIEEEVLTDQFSAPVPEPARFVPAEKVERGVPREEKFTAPPVREAPVAPRDLATAAAIAATKAFVAAPVAIDKPTAPQLSKSDLEAIARETIEKVVWEVVPQLAEAILREEIEKLVREKLSE